MKYPLLIGLLAALLLAALSFSDKAANIAQLLMWLSGVTVFWSAVHVITKKWQSPALGLLRALLRSQAVSVAFAPTVVTAGFIAFPLPASAVLLVGILDSNEHSYAYDQNIHVARVSFFGFWACCFLVALIFFGLRNKHLFIPSQDCQAHTSDDHDR